MTPTKKQKEFDRGPEPKTRPVRKIHDPDYLRKYAGAWIDGSPLITLEEIRKTAWPERQPDGSM